jgi:hypothetical protein
MALSFLVGAVLKCLWLLVRFLLRAVMIGAHVCTGAVSANLLNVGVHSVSFPSTWAMWLCLNPKAASSLCFRIGLAFCAAIPSAASIVNALVWNACRLPANVGPMLLVVSKMLIFFFPL